MQPVRIALLLAALGSVSAQAGVFDDTEARRQVTDLSIKTEARFDQQARGQLELSGQIQRQAEEIARLRGQVETLNYELETAKKRQQDFYLDLDTRLRKLEPQTGGNAGADPAGAANTKPTGDPAREGQEYEAALNQFKAAKYKEAGAAFATFVQKYPDSSLAPNAQYWLGNAWYAQRNCTKAIEAQSVVTTKYADNAKAPDAWLAIATCQQELGNPTGTKRSLETVIAKYPNTPAAESAQQRLKKK
ncbi:tol-pal system protein YbgF [Azonexus sp. IMCC34842]|uniref:tol-pal system protein YbgF n=1 Tax=Azonexus sp. IMCC34842 TaxID=3420950 RepID=UPI003D0B011F